MIFIRRFYKAYQRANRNILMIAVLVSYAGLPVELLLLINKTSPLYWSRIVFLNSK